MFVEMGLYMIYKTIIRRFWLNWWKLFGLGLLFILSMSLGIYFDNIVSSHVSYKYNTIGDNKLVSASIFSNYDNSSSKNIVNYLNRRYKMSGHFDLIENKVVDLNDTKVGDVTKGTDLTNITQNRVSDYTQVQKVNNISIVSGSSNIGNGEVLINMSYSKDHKKKVSDSIFVSGKLFKVKGIYNDYRVLIKSRKVPTNNILLNDYEFDKLSGLEKPFIEFRIANSFSGDKLDFWRDNLLNDVYLRDKISSIVMNSENPASNVWSLDNLYSFLSFVSFIFLGVICLILTCVVIIQVIQNMSCIFSTLKTLGYQKNSIIKTFVLIVCGFYLVLSFIPLFVSNYFTRINIVNTNKDLFIRIPLEGFYLSKTYIFVFIIFLAVIVMTIIAKTNEILKLDIVDIKSFQRGKVKMFLFVDKLNFRNITGKVKFKILLSSPLRAFSLYLGSVIASLLLIVFCVISFSILTSLIDEQKLPISRGISYDVKNTYYEDKEKKLFYFNGFNVVGSNFKSKKILSKYSPFPLRLIALSKVQMKEKNVSNDIVKDSSSGIIIQKSFSSKYGIHIGDILSVVNPFDDLKTYKFKVSGISDEMVLSYTNVQYLGKQMNLNNPFNASFGKNSVIKSHHYLNLEEIYLNAKKGIVQIIPILIFGCIFAFCFINPIISICAGFIIEENKKTISILKSIGYQYKQINNMIINVYSLVLFAGCVTSTVISMLFMNGFFQVLQDSGLRFLVEMKWNIYANLVGVIITYFIYLVSIRLKIKKIKKQYSNKEL